MALVTPNTLHRREYKFLIDEDTVAGIRRHIAGICTVDPYAERSGGRYTIDTLYLDTPQLHSYWATVRDAGDRQKLRIRGYPSVPDGPVFFEVKRRIGDSIIKTRGSVRGAWADLLAGATPELLATIEPKQRRGIDNFICAYYRAAMGPTTLVRYEREPYFSLVDEYARVTFDRSVSFQRATELSLVPEQDQWTYTDAAASQRGMATSASAVLLELKFTSVVPGWMRALVQRFDLQRLSFCKYTRAIDSLNGRPAPRVARAGFWR